MTCPRYRHDGRGRRHRARPEAHALRAAADVPLALGIVGLGIATVL